MRLTGGSESQERALQSVTNIYKGFLRLSPSGAVSREESLLHTPAAMTLALPCLFAGCSSKTVNLNKPYLVDFFFLPGISSHKNTVHVMAAGWRHCTTQV